MRLLRLAKIWLVSLKYGLDEFLTGHERFRAVRPLARALTFWRDTSAPRAARLRQALEDLGPIFVKFGQMLSTRRDLIPLDIADELAKLQDRVPPFSSDEVMATLTRVLVTGNSVTGTDLKGGGIFNDGPMTIDQSTIAGNTAGSTAGSGSGLGGGVFNQKTLTLTRSTIAGNNALNGDGFFITAGQATLENVTITGNGQNSAQGRGGGILSDGGSLSLAWFGRLV